MMRPETHAVVSNLWATLPPNFRINHTGYDKPRVDDEIWEVDQSADRMECIRSQDIMPILEANWLAEVYVPYFAISRRFFDTMYGPNYDLRQPLDRAVFDWIWELDLHYLAGGHLKQWSVASSSSETLRPAGY
jgi:hypothetical protein